MPQSEAELLRDFLDGRNISCPVCTYNLRGVADARCPECGFAVTLALHAPDARLGPWLFATIAFALALGFDAVGSLLAMVPLIFFLPPAGGIPLFFIVGLSTLLALGAASALGLFFMLRLRSWWQRRPVRDQWSRAALVFLVVFVVHAIGGLLIAI